MHRLLSLALIGALFAPAAATATTNPNDPFVPQQWYLNKVQAFNAWDETRGSNEVVVAVLDTGVDLDHIDLGDNVWVNPGEIPGDGIDNDANGFADDVNGWDFVDDDGDPSPDTPDDSDEGAVAHGTVIAGVIGAVGNNNQGIAGLNWDVRIMSVRMLDEKGSGSSSHGREAVNYAVANGADIINLSFTGFELDSSFQDAIKAAYEAGVVVVAAVGNDPDGGVNIDAQPIYPACFSGVSGDWVIGVAATDEGDEKADFSNYGTNCTDIAAPGISIFSTTYHENGNPKFPQPYQGGWAGTSIASPMIAGAAALLRAKYPTITPSQIKTALQLSVDPLKTAGTLWHGKLGSGRLNIDQAFDIAQSFLFSEESPSPPTPTPPQTGAFGAKLIAVAPEKDLPPLVRVFNDRGEVQHEFMAYEESFTGGVRLELSDVDGDDEPEIVTVPGSGMAAIVKMFEIDGTLIREFRAFDLDQTSGFYVSAGDVNRDGVADIAVSPDTGGSGEVRVFKPDGRYLAGYRPFGETSAAIRVTVADIEGNGLARVMFVRGVGHEPLVKITDGSGIPLGEFLAYDATLTSGIFVSSGDVDGDGMDEIVTGTDVGGGPQVRAFDGDGTGVLSFFAYDEAFRGGVRLGVGSLGGSRDDIVTSAGPGGGPHVRIFNGDGTAIGGFFSDEEADRNGINVAVWNR